MYKLSESVEFFEIEHTWTKLWPFKGGGPNRAFTGQKSRGKAMLIIIIVFDWSILRRHTKVIGVSMDSLWKPDYNVMCVHPEVWIREIRIREIWIFWRLNLNC